MTPDEFAKHLTTQPWASSYITNLITYNSTNNAFQRPIGNYIGNAFSWYDTSEGAIFWNSLWIDMYDADDYLLSDLLSVLPTYFPNNPELFI